MARLCATADRSPIDAGSARVTPGAAERTRYRCPGALDNAITHRKTAQGVLDEVPTHRSRRAFRNNYAAAAKSLVDVLPWQFQWSGKHLPVPPLALTPCLVADLAFGRSNASAARAMEPAVAWVGHATVLVQASGLNVVTDPISSARASPMSFLGPRRHQPPGLAPGDLPGIDVFVLSHNDGADFHWYLTADPGCSGDSPTRGVC